MKRLFLLCFAFMVALQANAQFNKTPIFAENDKINIDFDRNGIYFYNHNIRKGHTIYGLSKAFNIPIDDIYMLNNLTSSSTISVGDNIKIPIEPSKLIQTSYEPTNGSFIPVTYKVKPKETVFRIARMYFNQSIDDFRSRNNIYDNTLSIGQNVKVGWLPIYATKGPEVVSTPTYTTTQQSTTYTQPTTSTTTTYRTVQPSTTTNGATYTTRPSAPVATTTRPSTSYTTYRPATTTTRTAPTKRDVQGAINSSRPVSASDSVMAMTRAYPAGFRPDLLGRAKYVSGMTMGDGATVAHWDKTIPDNGVAYALHNDATPNSYIWIYNPNLKRSIKAKVIGSIPFGSYTDDVKLVISPRAAKMLGGLDQRFRVETKYIKK